jgi:hypothetical protein
LSSSLVRLEGSEREICFAPMFREIKGLRLEVATHEILFEDQGPEDPFFFSQAANLHRMSNKFLLVGWRRRWNRSLLQFLSRRVRAAVDIEDLAQETYLRLLSA